MVEHGGLLLQRHIGQLGRVLLSGRPVGEKVACGPQVQHPQLRGRQRRMLARRVGRRHGHGVAIQPGPGLGRCAITVKTAEGIRNLLAQLGPGRARAVEPGDPRFVICTGRPAPAELGCKALVRPLQAALALEYGQDVPAEGDVQREGGHARVDVHILHQVLHGAHRLHLRAVVGRRNRDPCRIHRHGNAGHDDLRAHRAVGHIVMPALVVRKRGGLGAIHGGRDAPASQHEKLARLFNAQFAQINRLAAETAAVECHRGRAFGNSAGSRSNGQAFPVLHRGIAQNRGIGRCGFRHVQRQLELIPGSLGIGQFDFPFDFVLVGRDFTHHFACGVVAVDAKARSLALERALRITQAARRHGRHMYQLGADIVLIRAIANTRHTNSRVYGSTHNGGVDSHLSPFQLLRH